MSIAAHSVWLFRLCLCSIQQSAALALGRLANYSDDLAEAVVQNEILPQLVRFGITGSIQRSTQAYRPQGSVGGVLPMDRA